MQMTRTVDEFGRVCKRRKLKVNAGKSKVVVFERAREQTIDFAKPYRVGSEAIPEFKIWLEKEEEVNEFKYSAVSRYEHPYVRIFLLTNDIRIPYIRIFFYIRMYGRTLGSVGM